jgi:hypothetical protein
MPLQASTVTEITSLSFFAPESHSSKSLSFSVAYSHIMSLVGYGHFINDLSDLNGFGVVLSAGHPTGLKLREQRLACCAALPDDTHANSSKRCAQRSGEFIGRAAEPSYLWCIVKH